MSHRCFECSKEFQSEDALIQHKKAIHGMSEQQALQNSSPKERKYFYIIIGALVAVLLVFWLMTSLSSGKYDNFAKCLSEKGAIFYGAWWCSHCQEQKNLFEGSEKYLHYVECSSPDGNSQLPACAAAGITGYPTWVFADGSRANQMTLEELSLKTSCALPL